MDYPIRALAGRASMRELMLDMFLLSAAPMTFRELCRLLVSAHEQTIRVYLREAVASGHVVQCEEVVRTGARPAHLYERGSFSLNDLAQLYGEDWINLPENRTCMLIHSGNAAGLLALVDWGFSK
jgi:hypothetical protein